MFEHDFECLTMCFLHKAICNTTTLLINFSQSFKRFFFSSSGYFKEKWGSLSCSMSVLGQIFMHLLFVDEFFR